MNKIIISPEKFRIRISKAGTPWQRYNRLFFILEPFDDLAVINFFTIHQDTYPVDL
jgi:hypothetical protein